MKKLVVVLAVLLVLVGMLLLPVGGGSPAEALEKAPVSTMKLDVFSLDKPSKPLRLLFVHHSCGGQLFAPRGPEGEIANCIYTAHPNGGNLRDALRGQGYEVHEASYGSEIGENTDLFDWAPKFRNKMAKVLTLDINDSFYKDERRNSIVVFKSCYPNNDFVGDGEPPGSEAGPDLTYWNARAALSALLPEFRKHPETLFVYVTAPPRAPKVDKERAFKVLLKAALGKPTASEAHARSAAIARKFNNWVVATDGWLKDYPEKNVVVFDYYDALTAHGASNLSRYATEDGYDSHPSSEGNSKAAVEFVPFLNRAVRRAGLAE